MKIKIVDDFLPEYHCNIIEKFLAGNEFPWRFQDHLNEQAYSGNYYFYHYLVNDGYSANPALPVFQPILDKLSISVSQIWRMKVNMYPGTQRRIHHEPHYDYDSNSGLMTCLYFPHTTNAPTVLHLNKWKRRAIKCKRNRALFFDGSNMHHSTSPTDSNYRTSVNVDYKL